MSQCPHIYPNMKGFSFFMKGSLDALSSHTTKVANKFCPLLRRHVSSKLMGMVRFSGPGLHSNAAQIMSYLQDLSKERGSHSGRGSFSAWVRKRYENISL